LIKYID